MVLNTTFNNISVISWRSEVSYIVAVSFIDGGNQSTQRKPQTCHWQTLSHNVVTSTPRHERVRTHNISGNRH